MLDPKPDSGNRKPSRLLLIDDEAIVRRNISAFLQDCGYEVLEADTGSKGVDLFISHKPDLVLCDLRMPGFDGLEVIKQLSEQGRHTPVIVISGLGEIHDVVQALRLGASDYHIKPIRDLEVLEYSIRRGLQQARLMAENKRYATQLEKSNSQLQNSLDLLRLDQQAGLHVQTSLLPATPLKYSGYTLQHKIIPSLYLSGDFIDYWVTSNGNMMFYIADVSGHGASSAFVTVLLKYLAQRLPHQDQRRELAGDPGPAQVLTALNQELLLADLKKHVTAFMGLLDTKTHILHYSTAGHYPMPVVGQNGCFQFLEGRSFPLGVKKEPNFEQHTFDLGEQASINLFSDGVLELLKAGTLVEKEWELLELLSRSEGDFGKITQALKLSEVKDAPDDVAILSVAANSDQPPESRFRQ